jgi:hypothetical protein
VEGNPGILLVRVPEGHPAPPPDGFTGGWVQFRTNQLSKDELRALGGRRESGWDGTKYDDKAAAAMARLNKLLKEQANINTPLAL